MGARSRATTTRTTVLHQYKTALDINYENAELMARLREKDRPTINREDLIAHLKLDIETETSCLSLPFAVAFLLSFVVAVNTHEEIGTVYQFEEAIRNDVLNTISWDDGFKTFRDVTTSEEFWRWLEEGFVPRIWRQNANGERRDYLGNLVPFDQWDRILTYNKLIGGARLEQKRARSEDCDVDTLSMYFGTRCNPDLKDDEDDQPFSDSNVEGFKAHENTYVATLDVMDSPLHIWDRISKLKQGSWIDMRTNTVNVKLALYNAELSSGLLCVIDVQFTFQRGGQVKKVASTYTIHTEPYHHIEVLLVDFLFLGCIAYMGWNEGRDVVEAVKEGELESYCSPWNVVDWISVFAGFVLAVVWLVIVSRTAGITDSMLELQMLEQDLFADSFLAWRNGTAQSLALMGQQPPNWGADRMSAKILREGYRDFFEDLGGLLDIGVGYRALQAMVCAIAMLRFFKAFSTQPMLRIVTETLRVGFVDVVHFVIVFFSVFLSYALGGVLLFGHSLKSFQSIDYALYTCFNILFGDFNFGEMASVSVASAFIWFWTYIMLVCIILLNMLLAIILDTYAEVKASSEGAMTLAAQASQMIRRHREFKLGARLDLGEILESIENGDWCEDDITADDMVKNIVSLPIAQADRIIDRCRDWIRLRRARTEEPMTHLDMVRTQLTLHDRLMIFRKEIHGFLTTEREEALNALKLAQQAAMGSMRQANGTGPSKLDTRKGDKKLEKLLDKHLESAYLQEALEPILERRGTANGTDIAGIGSNPALALPPP